MKLWELRPIPGAEPWQPANDKVIGLIVRAEHETAARMLAREKHGGEGGFVWLDPQLTTCVELLPEGDGGVVMVDLYPG